MHLADQGFCAYRRGRVLTARSGPHYCLSHTLQHTEKSGPVKARPPQLKLVTDPFGTSNMSATDSVTLAEGGGSSGPVDPIDQLVNAALNSPSPLMTTAPAFIADHQPVNLEPPRLG